MQAQPHNAIQRFAFYALHQGCQSCIPSILMADHRSQVWYDWEEVGISKANPLCLASSLSSRPLLLPSSLPSRSLREAIFFNLERGNLLHTLRGVFPAEGNQSVVCGFRRYVGFCLLPCLCPLTVYSLVLVPFDGFQRVIYGYCTVSEIHTAWGDTVFLHRLFNPKRVAYRTSLVEERQVTQAWVMVFQPPIRRGNQKRNN